MNTNATDFRDAWVKTEAFLKNKAESFLMLGIDTAPYKCSYTFVKLPYGEDILLLYAIDSNQAVDRPCSDMKYAGFYNLKNSQAYVIREPLDRFFGFDRKFISESDMKEMLTRAIQNAMVSYIESHIEEFSGLSVGDTNADAADAVVEAFGRKQAKVDFARRIEIKDYYISARDMVDFIADPDSLLAKKVDFHIKGHEKELARLWVATCAAQKILDDLNTKIIGGSHSEE